MGITLVNNTCSELMKIVWDDMLNFSKTHEISEDLADIFEYRHFSNIETKKEYVVADFKED